VRGDLPHGSSARESVPAGAGSTRRWVHV